MNTLCLSKDFVVKGGIREVSMIVSWDHQSWLARFAARSTGPNYYRDLRKEVFHNTVEIIREGRYESISGNETLLDNDKHQNSMFYPDTRLINFPKPIAAYDTKIYTLEADCLETSRLLQLTGYNPAVLNMANAYNPGGAVTKGSGAQEENLFRRSTAFMSLYQFVDYCQQYGVKRNLEFSYPIPEEAGGIYSPDLLVFRYSERTGYYLLDSPYPMQMISVAAFSHPPMEVIDGKLRIIERMISPTKEKIRAILRIGKAHGHDALVLSAWGCGAFRNPPEHMAELFREVLSENIFSHAFRLIVFTIIDDHNAHKLHNPLGNVIPFQVVFNQ